MISLWLDLRHAARALVKQAGVTFIVILTLGLGIGATTAIFSVVYGVLLRPLPYPRPEGLAAIWEVNHRGTHSRLADPNFDDFRDRNRTFSMMAKYTEWVTSITGAGEPTRTAVAAVTRDFFQVIGIQPALGRGLTAVDARLGAEPVVIVSHRYWTGTLGSSRPLSATHLRIEDRVYTLVGVMPSGFQFPANVDVWRPAELDPENTSRTSHNYRAIGRLRDGVAVARASADLSAIAKDVIRHSPEQGEYLLADAEAIPLQASLTGRVGSALYVLLGAVFFLLLVACANVTNLLLAQAAARQRELAVRHALGAGRGRIVRQFVAEALVLAAAGCLMGLVIASLGVSGLLALAPADLPRLEEVSLSWPVLGFASGLSGLVALALGLLTAWRATRRDPRETLLGGGRGQAGTGSSQRIGRVIVAAQLAITVVLLVGAALLGRSLQRVLSVDPGFRTDHIVTMDLKMPSSDDQAAGARLSAFYADTLGRLRAIPGVDEVAAASAVPLDGGLPDGMFLHLAPGDAPHSLDDLRLRFQRKDRFGTADYCAASPGYFHTLGIPLMRGRLFDERDGPDRPHVAVVNESLARAQWPGDDPIGRTVEFGNMDGDLRPITIVGVVGDTREYGLEQPPRPTLYVDILQRPGFSATVVMRSGVDPRAVTTAATAVLRQVAPDVPPRVRTFDEIVAASLGARHFNLTLVAVFASAALWLAVAGIYSVTAYTVTRRRREIGVRMALGASPRQVVGGILGHGLATTAAGLAAGVLAALALTRALRSLLFEVTPTDPVTFAAVTAVLAGVAALACYAPASRASRVDPVEALRQE